MQPRVVEAYENGPFPRRASAIRQYGCMDWVEFWGALGEVAKNGGTLVVGVVGIITTYLAGDRAARATAMRGLGAPRWLKSQDVIAYADKHADVESVLLSWRLCSAFAHGYPWAGMSLHDKTVVPGAPEGTVYLRMTNRLDSALFPALTGALLLQEVLRRYDERRRADT